MYASLNFEESRTLDPGQAPGLAVIRQQPSLCGVISTAKPQGSVEGFRISVFPTALSTKNLH
jgi:hypothetical protein